MITFTVTPEIRDEIAVALVAHASDAWPAPSAVSRRPTPR
jgi:hypothetical protein